MTIHTFALSLGKAEKSNDYGAEVSVYVPWGDLPQTHQRVTVTLFVDHDFTDMRPLHFCLQIIAHRADGKEDSSLGSTDHEVHAFSYYPTPTMPITLTLGDVRYDRLDQTLDQFNNILLEQFVNTTVEHTACTLTHDDETGTLTASLRWKHSGELLMETVFNR